MPTTLIQRHYKYLLKPNAQQKEVIVRTFGAVRFVYNRYLDDLKAGKIMPPMAKDIVNGYRKEYEFLNVIDGSALMNTIFQAQDKAAVMGVYKKRNDQRASYCTANLIRSPIRIVGDRYIQLPKLGNVELVYHRPLPGDARIKKATIMREGDGKYYVSVMIESYPQIPKAAIDLENSIGIDYSSPHFFIDDQGNRIDMPHFYQNMQDRLSQEKKKLNRMKKGSKNYYEQKMKMAALYQKVKNQRMDYLHKLTTKIADKYDVVCMEDLDMQQISQHFDLGKRTYDNAYGLFSRLLKYKMKQRGKLLLYADRYFPSSKTCHVCGYVNYNLKLSDRFWQCPQCKTYLDRDVNAARTIKIKCIQDYKCRRVSGQSL